jgi:hypothetical protein
MQNGTMKRIPKFFLFILNSSFCILHSFLGISHGYYHPQTLSSPIHSGNRKSPPTRHADQVRKRQQGDAGDYVYV